MHGRAMDCSLSSSPPSSQLPRPQNTSKQMKSSHGLVAPATRASGNNNCLHNDDQTNQLTRFLTNEQQDEFIKSQLTHKMRFKLFTSELLGTFFLVYLSQTALTSFEFLGTQNDIITRRLATILTYGLAYLLASLITLNLSGAHLNPAYTFACASFGRLRWTRAFNYIAAQYLGSFLAAIFLHATYSDKLAQRHNEGLLIGMNSTLRAHGNILSTGKFFSSYPPTEVSLTQLNISYTLASAMLSCLLRVIYKSRLIRIPRTLRPMYLAAAYCLVQAAFSANGGPVLNPAQDFSPRLYIFFFGWGSAALNLYNYRYWWMCGILAPHIGALIGFALYLVLDHLRTIGEDETGNKLDEYADIVEIERCVSHGKLIHHHDISAQNFMRTPRAVNNFWSET